MDTSLPGSCQHQLPAHASTAAAASHSRTFRPTLSALFSLSQSRREAALAARRDLEVDAVYDHI